MSEHKEESVSSQPDLSDDLNVAEAHEKYTEEVHAVKREKRLKENGVQPIALWVLFVSAIPLLMAGAIIGKIDKKSRSLESVWARNYTPPPTIDDAGPPTGTLLEAYSRAGKKVYSKCTGCHQADGKGDGVNYPPLEGSEWVTGENTEALAMIILKGVTGEIKVAGKTWNVPGGMAPQASGLGAKELATLMTYIRNDLGNNTGDVVSIEMAQSVLDKAAKTSDNQQTVQSLDKEHNMPLEGEVLDPETIVDLVTLEPAGDE